MMKRVVGRLRKSVDEWEIGSWVWGGRERGAVTGDDKSEAGGGSRERKNVISKIGSYGMSAVQTNKNKQKKKREKMSRDKFFSFY